MAADQDPATPSSVSAPYFSFEREQWFPAEREDVFAYFVVSTNLEQLNPPDLRFKVAACSTEELGQGTIIDYTFRVKGIPMGWKSLLRNWNAPHSFVDEMLAGPYRTWVHTHSFDECEGGTLVRDSVRYTLPVPRFAARWVDRTFVRPDLDRIFAFRQARLAEVLGEREP